MELVGNRLNWRNLHKMILGGNSHILRLPTFSSSGLAPLCLHVNMMLSSIQLFLQPWQIIYKHFLKTLFIENWPHRPWKLFVGNQIINFSLSLCYKSFIMMFITLKNMVYYYKWNSVLYPIEFNVITKSVRKKITSWDDPTWR